MRLYTEHTEHYLHALAISLGKSPTSLEAWRCLHIQPQGEPSRDHQHIASVKEECAALDCDIVLCTDRDILLVSRTMDALALETLAITLMPKEDTSTTLYNAAEDWRVLRALLLDKIGHTIPKVAAISETADFGEIDLLTDVFATAKSLRKSRQPQYVLVVDDDPLTRQIIATAFKANYAIVSACDAEEAVANYLLYAPDVVFLDIGLPGISGFAALKQILECDPEAYVVMFSGNSYLDNITKALGAGAAGFVAKPFKKDKLHRYIQDSQLHHLKTSHQANHYA